MFGSSYNKIIPAAQITNSQLKERNLQQAKALQEGCLHYLAGTLWVVCVICLSGWGSTLNLESEVVHFPKNSNRLWVLEQIVQCIVDDQRLVHTSTKNLMYGDIKESEEDGNQLDCIKKTWIVKDVILSMIKSCKDFNGDGSVIWQQKSCDTSLRHDSK